MYFVRDLSRKMRRKKLAPEAQKQRRAPDNLKMMSKISNMYFAHLFCRSVILAGAKILANMCILSILVSVASLAPPVRDPPPMPSSRGTPGYQRSTALLYGASRPQFCSPIFI